MNVLFNEFVLCLVGCVWFFYFIRKKRNVVMHSRFDVCVLIVLSELICYCEQSCFVLLNVFGIIFFFGRRGVVLRRCLCWFRFPPSVFFGKRYLLLE